MANSQSIEKRLLQSVISRQVSEKLNGIGNLYENKELSEGETITAKLMLLEMIRVGCDEYYNKMKPRFQEKISNWNNSPNA